MNEKFTNIEESIPEEPEITKCDKCNESNRNLYIGNYFSQKRICPNCDINPGICPNCGSPLRTDKAQQCGKCNASWRETPPAIQKQIIKDNHFLNYAIEIRCPKCKSTSISANKRGFGLGKAVIGGVLMGGVGLLGGCIGSNNIKITCLKCGHSWKPG